MQYTIINVTSKYSHEAIANLEAKVQTLLSNGWKPQGGIGIATTFVGTPMSGDKYYIVVQAMIKED